MLLFNIPVIIQVLMQIDSRRPIISSVRNASQMFPTREQRTRYNSAPRDPYKELIRCRLVHQIKGIADINALAGNGLTLKG